VSRRPDKIEITLAVHRETDRAYLVEAWDSGLSGEEVWIPKSLLEKGEQLKVNHRLPVYTFTISEDIAIEKGLI
jgi:hypothetical protein